MKKLTKTQQGAKAELVTKLSEAYSELVQAAGDFAADLEEKWQEDVQPKLDAYNEVIARAEEFKGEIVDAQQQYIEARSDKWQESDAASQYQDWSTAWSELDFTEVELDKPEFEGYEGADLGAELEQVADELDG